MKQMEIWKQYLIPYRFRKAAMTMIPVAKIMNPVSFLSFIYIVCSYQFFLSQYMLMLSVIRDIDEFLASQAAEFISIPQSDPIEVLNNIQDLKNESLDILDKCK